MGQYIVSVLGSNCEGTALFSQHKTPLNAWGYIHETTQWVGTWVDCAFGRGLMSLTQSKWLFIFLNLHFFYLIYHNEANMREDNNIDTNRTSGLTLVLIPITVHVSELFLS